MNKPGMQKLPILGGMPEVVYETYQSIRFSKMANAVKQSDTFVNIRRLYSVLQSQTANYLTIRLHYSANEYIDYPFGPKTIPLVQAFVKYQKECSFKFIYANDTYEVLEIGFPKVLLELYFTDGKINALLEESSLIEIVTPKKEQKSFLGQHPEVNIPQEYLYSNMLYSEPPVMKKEKAPEYIDLWIALLREKWDEFYRDVKDKECSLVYYTRGTYAIRRKFFEGRPAIFETKEDLRLLNDLQVSAIIPNCHTQQLQERPLSIEAVIDVDPTRFTTGDQVVQLLNSLTNYLVKRSITFYKRLSSGPHNGFHILVPLKIDKAYDMITNIASPQNYLHNLEEKIIINSVRESVLALLLDYIKEHTSQNILDYVTIEQDPYKAAFDYSKTALKVGRRALYSMHKGTSKVVLPLPANELITRRQLEEYEQLSAIDQAYAHSERLRERTITEQEARKNTQQLGYLNQEHRELWKNYHMAQNKKMFLKKMI